MDRRPIQQGSLQPQSERLFESSSDPQIPNNAGSFVYKLDDMKRLMRFLIIGSERTYYAREKELERENADCIDRLISANRGNDVVQTIKNISINRRNVRQNSLLLAYAICARSNNVDTKTAAYDLLSQICRIPTHLFMFIKHCEEESRDERSDTGTGWGRAHKRAISNWYTNFEQNPEKLARLITKYKNREDWNHKDVLRLSHTCTEDHVMGFIFRHLSLDYTEEEFIDRFRFSYEGTEYITNILSPFLKRETNRNKALSVESQVLIALRYYASGSHMRVVGDTLGFHISTVSRAVRDVSSALCRIGSAYIRWPRDGERRQIRDGFFDIAGFPGVMGAIDCTHVRIQSPTEYENTFVNRKGFHSVNVQAVCDHRGKFLNLLAKWPGSCHDSFILRTSDLAEKLERDHRGFDIDGVLLGDSGYACGKYLVTPYSNPSNNSQTKYNQAHSKTRAVIERCFGWWKRRFAVLHGEIRMHPERVINVINACGVLHNIALYLNEPMFGEPLQEDVAQAEDEDAGNGRHVRDFIANNYFS